MKRFLLIGLMVLSLAAPAMADVDLAVVINKDVAIDWDQNSQVQIDLDMPLEKADIKVDQAAVADAFLNQKIEVNEFFLDEAEKKKKEDYVGVDAFDKTEDSINGNSGITGVNQASGSLNNQGNTVAVSVVTGTKEKQVDEFAYKPNDPNKPEAPKKDPKDATFVQSIGAADQKNVDNTLVTTDTESKAEITGSVNDNSGITGFNQSPGNFNNQGNVVAVAAGLEGVDVALAEADLGQFHTGAALDQLNYSNSSLISGSINGNSGITHVNQSSGNMNNQGNVVSIAVVKGFNAPQ